MAATRIYRYRSYAIALLLSIVFWVGDSWVHAHHFTHTNFYQNLFDESAVFRIVMVVLIFAFSHYVQKFQNCYLQQQHERMVLKAVTETTQDAIFFKDMERKYSFVNPAMEKQLGLSAQELLGKTPQEIFNEKDAKVVTTVDDIVYGGKIADEVRSLEINGKTLYFHTVQTPFYDNNGNLRGICGVVRNITIRKKAEQALRESEMRFRLLCEASPVGIFQTDNKGNIIFTNERTRTITGMSEREALGFGWSLYIAPEDKERVLKAWQETWQEGKEISIEFRMVKKSGEKRWVCVHSAPIIVDEIVTGYVGIADDFTERKQIEENLLKARKLESVGILAGGIAHDFNNILTVLWGNISLMKMDIIENEELVELLSQAEKACQRAGCLTKQLLTFAKGGEPIKQSTSIISLLKESIDFSVRNSPVECLYDFADDLSSVEVDPEQIHQVIQNLANNAVHAMPHGGLLKTTVRNFEMNKNSNLPLKNGTYLEIIIQDNGCGIAENIIPKIFDPYFTTKEMGNGLGLATSYSIINKHKGHIAVKSRLKVGTSFYVYLPAFAKLASLSEENFGKKGKILIMDDEFSVINVAVRIVTKLGYEANYASNGIEAIEMYEKSRQSDCYIAAILDLTIPGAMGGVKCAEKIKNIDPEARLIVCSGYAHSPEMVEYQKYGFDAALIKPFEIHQIAEVLKRLTENSNN